MRYDRLLQIFGALAGAIILVSTWHVASTSGLIPALFFPTPQRTLTAISAIIARGDFWEPLRETVNRMLTGWLTGGVLGVVIGALLAGSGWFRAYVETTLQFLRPMPAAAIIPPAILLLGLGNEMSIVVISYGALWPVLLGAYHGFGNVEPRLGDVATALQMRPLDYFFKISLPSALPDIFAGFRISLTTSLILTVVTEIYAGQRGLGHNMLLAERLFRGAEVFAGIIFLAVLGLLVSRTLLYVEGRTMRWRDIR